MAETLHKVRESLLKDEVTLIWTSQAREEQSWMNLTSPLAILNIVVETEGKEYLLCLW